MTGPSSTRRGRPHARRSLLLAAVSLVTAGTLAACSGIRPEPSAPTTPATPTPTPVTSARLGPEFTALRGRVGGDLALAWAPVGRPDAVQVLGAVPDVEAWSTLKVPIAAAVDRGASGTPSAPTQALMREAITISDNEAAAALWDGLGDDAAAASAVDAVLEAGGDAATRAGRDGSGKEVPFGLTRWTLPDSARFATGLPCLANTGDVWRLMGTIDPDHRWGLGRVPQARFKGGWGPSPHGYLMRQVGVVPLEDGSQVAVALATRPPDGDHEHGAAALSETATWFAARLTTADGGRCR